MPKHSMLRKMFLKPTKCLNGMNWKHDWWHFRFDCCNVITSKRHCCPFLWSGLSNIRAVHCSHGCTISSRRPYCFLPNGFLPYAQYASSTKKKKKSSILLKNITDGISLNGALYENVEDNHYRPRWQYSLVCAMSMYHMWPVPYSQTSTHSIKVCCGNA